MIGRVSQVVVLLTIGSMFYGDPIITFPTYREAWLYAVALGIVWYEIEVVL